MGKNKKKNNNNENGKDPLEYVALPEVKLGPQAKRSIFIIFLFVLGLISLLGLFDLSGKLGSFFSRLLILGFGWGKWIWPLILLSWAWFLFRGKKHHITLFNYFGLLFLFLSYQSLFHFFYEAETAKEVIALGQGGGYVGFGLSIFFKNIFGFWGGLIILIALFLTSLILILNTSLHALIGRDSFIGRFSLSIAEAFRALFTKKENLEEEIEDVIEEEMIEDEAPLEEALPAKAEEPGKEVFVFKEKKIKEEKEEAPVISSDALRPSARIKRMRLDLPLDLLENQKGQAMSGDIERNKMLIKHTLENFGIMVEMGETSVGPTVTQYTFKPAEGVKLSRVTALNNDLSLALAAHPIRIEAPIPGKALVGIEVPNKTKAMVGLKEILEDKSFKTRSSNLLVALGKDVSGTNWLYDIPKMPHLLVAGATNSGKSVCLNAIIVSLLYQNNPETLRFIMVDPKRVELPAYNGIPHLLTPVITEVSKTINALKWCLNEMDRRYDILNKVGKKNIQSYNSSNPPEKMPYIVFVIDELADLMVAAAKDIEGSIIRLTQMSRAVGIHLILATQRPSVDVITGLIKANIPARIAFAVASAIDSKTILDCSGAEKLLGKGDMLFSAADLSKPRRIQGAFLSDEEISRVTNYIKEKCGEAEYLEGVTERQKVSGVAGVGLDGTFGDEDELLSEAREVVISMGRASTSLLQRRLRIGYARAASILDMLEEAGIIGPANGAKPREILISKEQHENMMTQPISGMPVHDRRSSTAPENYLGEEDEGDDGTLAFENESPEEIEEIEEEEESLEEGNEVESDNPFIEKAITETPTEEKPSEKKPRVFDEEDEGMYFSR